MNVRDMYIQAQKAVLSPDAIEAHIVWALVSQCGALYMTVGEIGKLVKQTSGYRPTTYQVRKCLKVLEARGCVYKEHKRSTHLGAVYAYHCGDNAMALLMVHMWHFAENDVLWNAINAVTTPVRAAMIAQLNAIAAVNMPQEIEVQND